jgi:predicted transcriptional regulator YdeE
MESEELEKLYVIGILEIITSKNKDAGIDITVLERKFINNNVIDQIPNKIDNSINFIYTEYKLDYKTTYIAILGCLVSSLENIPKGMIGKALCKKNYTISTTIGNFSGGIVYNEWKKVWSKKLVEEIS